ncbi:MAG: sodium:proline symporter, partial [Lachnospiraceae bacterium]|nr:sodium:proline symporter [Lachnospiraceae bacterium]
GVVSGFLMDAFWYLCFSGSVAGTTIFNTGLYEIIPGFIVSMIVAVAVSLADKEPSADVAELVDKAAKPVE